MLVALTDRPLSGGADEGGGDTGASAASTDVVALGELDFFDAFEPLVFFELAVVVGEAGGVDRGSELAGGVALPSAWSPTSADARIDAARAATSPAAVGSKVGVASDFNKESRVLACAGSS